MDVSGAGAWRTPLTSTVSLEDTGSPSTNPPTLSTHTHSCDKPPSSVSSPAQSQDTSPTPSNPASTHPDAGAGCAAGSEVKAGMSACNSQQDCAPKHAQGVASVPPRTNNRFAVLRISDDAVPLSPPPAKDRDGSEKT